MENIANILIVIGVVIIVICVVIAIMYWGGSDE